MTSSTVHPMTRAGLQSTYLTGSGSVVPSWLLFHISFMLKSKMKEKRLDAWQNFNYLSMMWAASFLNQIYKHYPVLEKYFLNFLCYLQCYNYREDTCISLICIMELFSTTFFFFPTTFLSLTLLLLLRSHFSCVWLCATPETAAHQVPPFLGFSRQEHWSGLPFPSPDNH